jgi:hypothetical protein
MSIVRSAKENKPVPVTTSPDNAVRLFTIKEAAEVLRIPIEPGGTRSLIDGSASMFALLRMT